MKMQGCDGFEESFKKGGAEYYRGGIKRAVGKEHASRRARCSRRRRATSCATATATTSSTATAAIDGRSDASVGPCISSLHPLLEGWTSHDCRRRVCPQALHSEGGETARAKKD
jgi:hypothetical protein